VLVAGRARLVEPIAEGGDGLDVPDLRELERVGAGVEHQLGVGHPLVLIAGAAGHHQQVRGFGDHQRLAFEHRPFRVRLRRPRLDVEERV
jgi:hypothetical protein